MGAIGAPEMIIVLVIVLLLFGAKKLPDLASSMGKSIREFRKAADERDEAAPPHDVADEERSDADAAG